MSVVLISSKETLLSTLHLYIKYYLVKCICIYFFSQNSKEKSDEKFPRGRRKTEFFVRVEICGVRKTGFFARKKIANTTIFSEKLFFRTCLNNIFSEFSQKIEAVVESYISYRISRTPALERSSAISL